MEENKPLYIKNEAGEELLVVDEQGQVFLEGKLVGKSPKLLDQLVKYKEGLVRVTETLKSMQGMADMLKKLKGK